MGRGTSKTLIHLLNNLSLALVQLEVDKGRKAIRPGNLYAGRKKVLLELLTHANQADAANYDEVKASGVPPPKPCRDIVESLVLRTLRFTSPSRTGQYCSEAVEVLTLLALGWDLSVGSAFGC